MRAIILALCFGSLAGQAAVDPPKKAPDKLVFEAKNGQVVFNHAAHVARQKGACNSCHNRLWPQSSKAPVRSGVGCGSCHLRGGRAFAMKGNCGKCHGTPSAKP